VETIALRRNLAPAGGSPTLSADSLPLVGRACRVHPVAGFLDVANTRRRTTDDACRNSLIIWTIEMDSVAFLGDVAVSDC